MADLPDSIGYLTVTGRAVLGLADSSDAGSEPDAVSAVAQVAFAPVLPNSDPLVAVAEELMIIPQTIKCALDSSGRLVPPADGVSSPAAPGAPTAVTLIAPNQLSLNFTGWSWRATFSPIAPQNWAPFVRYFSGAPGDEIKLSTLVATTPSPGVLQALIFDVATTDEPFPDGYRIGIDLLLTPDGNLWETIA